MRVDMNDAELLVQRIIDAPFDRDRHRVVAADHRKLHALLDQTFDIGLHFRKQGVAVFIDKITGV